MWIVGRKVILTSVGRMSLDDPLSYSSSDDISVSIVRTAEGAGEGSRPSAPGLGWLLEPSRTIVI